MWVIRSLPVLAAAWGWTMVYRNRHGNSRETASSIALVLLTISAMVNAVGTVYLVYFACVPKSTSWTALPEYRLDAYVILFALGTVITGFVGLSQGNSRKLCGMVLLVCGWQLLFALMHAVTI